MLFEHNIIDNLLILSNENGHVVVCNESQLNIIQNIYAPFDGEYTVLSQKNGCISISKRGYTLYVSGLSLDEKTRLKSSVEVSNLLGTTQLFYVNGKPYQAVEMWLQYDGKIVDIVPFCYRRDNTEFEPEKKVETNSNTEETKIQPKRKRK